MNIGSLILYILVALLSSACAYNDRYSTKTYSPTLSQPSSNNEECLIDDTVSLGNTVRLEGSQLYDSYDQLSYLWTIKSKPTESLAKLDFPTHVAPSFSADVQGEYVIELVVTNKYGETQPPATLTIGTSPPHWFTCGFGEKEAVALTGVAIAGYIVMAIFFSILWSFFII